MSGGPLGVSRAAASGVGWEELWELISGAHELPHGDLQHEAASGGRAVRSAAAAWITEAAKRWVRARLPAAIARDDA